jgi:hypothetical protein
VPSLRSSARAARERRTGLRCTGGVSGAARWTSVSALLAIALLGPSCGVVPPKSAVGSPATALPRAADRSTPGGEVVRRCGSHYAAEFDAGLESRTVGAGPVSLVAFRVPPEPAGTASVRAFKMMVRLAAGSEARLETVTEGTRLLYDRARFTDSNVYQLSDGERSVRFVGCLDQPSVFNGAILTTGPTTVELVIITDGGRTDVRVKGYGS